MNNLILSGAFDSLNQDENVSSADFRKDIYQQFFDLKNKKKKPSKKELTDQLRKYVPNHMIPSYFHKVDKLPRTASGKVMRRKLRDLIEPETN